MSAIIIGIGRRQVSDESDHTSTMPCDFDLDKLEKILAGDVEAGKGSIVVASAGEVNTG